MPTIFDFQRATLAARQRLGDKSIGTRVNAGKIQVIRVSYPKEKRGFGSIEPISAWLSLDDGMAFIESMK